jgi:hypothetical protein
LFLLVFGPWFKMCGIIMLLLLLLASQNFLFILLFLYYHFIQVPGLRLHTGGPEIVWCSYPRSHLKSTYPLIAPDVAMQPGIGQDAGEIGKAARKVK